MNFTTRLAAAIREEAFRVLPDVSPQLLDQFTGYVFAKYSFAHSKVMLLMSGKRREEFESVLVAGAVWRVRVEAPLWRKAAASLHQARATGVLAATLPAPTRTEVDVASSSMEGWVGLYHKWFPLLIAALNLGGQLPAKWRPFIEAMSSVKWIRLPSGWRDVEEVTEKLKTERRKRGRRKKAVVKLALEVLKAAPMESEAHRELLDVATGFLASIRSWQVR